MKSRALLLLLISIVCSPLLDAQNQANVWYFGNGAGLDFNTTPPTQLQNGNAGLLSATGEGVGSISDASGVLEFYTNGNLVYNRNHLQMPNGSGLNGNGTTTQTGVIVPMPGNADKYYIFTPSDVDNPVKYSIVDMTLDGGLGDVEVATKNTSLLAAGSEAAVVIPHDNFVDYWVIFHASATNVYHVFLLTASGITGPTNYAVGNSGQATMIMKTNSCFNKIATAFYNQGIVDVVSFNNATGFISGAGILTISGYGAGGPFETEDVYGVEFSPNGRFLYVTESGYNGTDNVHQFDLQAGSIASIIASRRSHMGGSTVRSGALQLAPDGKIYVPAYTAAVPAYLSVIPNPNTQWLASPPTAAEFEYMKYTYDVKRVGEGLPPVLKNLLTSLRIFYNNACQGTATNFSFIFGSAVNPAAGSITWNFGDGTPVVTDQLTPSHTYASAGTYTVSLSVIDICGRTRSGTVNVIVKTGPTYTTPGTACVNQNIVITGTGSNAANYTWSSSPTGSPVLSTGSSYTYIGALPATVYVQDPTPLATYTVGNSTIGGHFSTNTGYVYFDVGTKLTVTSFKVLSRAAGTATFSIRDAATASTVYWTSAAYSPAAGGIPYTVTPNVALNPGSYVFYVSPDDVPFEKLNTSNGSGRDVVGVINILGEKNGTRGGLFYDIAVALPDPCGIRAINLTENCPLPVTFLDFYGELSESGTELFWMVANERNNKEFRIQKSLDGETFVDLGIIEGNNQAHYHFTDTETTIGVVYYRIVQVDNDGTLYASQTILFNANGEISIYPNPFHTNTVVYCSASTTSVSVFDITGKLLETHNGKPLSTIEVGESLSSGTYLIRVESPEKIETKKITKR